MNTLRAAILWMLNALAVSWVTPCDGADTDYSRLTGRLENHEGYWLPMGSAMDFCRAAAAANPSLVKQLNASAVACVRQIQKELVPIMNRHTTLSDFDNGKLVASEPNESGAVECTLEYFKNTHVFEMPSGMRPEPNKDGIVVTINVYNILGMSIPVYGADYEETVLVRGIELGVKYHLGLGEANKDIESQMRDIIVKHLKKFCADAVKMK